jgi:mannose-6-phosphate isomerase-like protein (cupin superfamily)
MKVERWNSNNDGPISERALRQKLERLGYEVARYTYPPGTSFTAHTHAVDKMDAVVSGEFRITIGKEVVVLGSGDAVYVPKGVSHSAEVVGHSSVISLDGVRLRD